MVKNGAFAGLRIRSLLQYMTDCQDYKNDVIGLYLLGVISCFKKTHCQIRNGQEWGVCRFDNQDFALVDD